MDAPDIEQQLKILQLDENLDGEVRRLTAEGWMINPAIKPVAIYHLVRVKNTTAPGHAVGGEARMVVDDNKVFTIKADGTVVGADGRIIKLDENGNPIG